MRTLTLAQRKMLGSLAKDGPREPEYSELRVIQQLERAGYVARNLYTENFRATDTGRAALVAAHAGDLVAVQEEHRYTGVHGRRGGKYTTITLGRVVSASRTGSVLGWKTLTSGTPHSAANNPGVRFLVCDGRLVKWPPLILECKNTPGLSFDSLELARNFLVRFMK